MILQTSENTNDYEPSIRTYKQRPTKLGSDGSKFQENRSGNSKRSRFTSNSKLIKNSLYRTIEQKGKVYQQAQIEQKNLEIQLLKTASDNLSRDLISQQHQMGHAFLRFTMLGQLTLSKLALK